MKARDLAGILLSYKLEQNVNMQVFYNIFSKEEKMSTRFVYITFFNLYFFQVKLRNDSECKTQLMRLIAAGGWNVVDQIEDNAWTYDETCTCEVYVVASYSIPCLVLK